MDDPVSSLRAAALLTRKIGAKRQKLSQDPSSAGPGDAPLLYNYNLPLNSENTTSDGETTKEEGEISDEADDHVVQVELQSKQLPAHSAPFFNPARNLPNLSPYAPQARPNLNMTDEQLWEAKVIVLDLLGWGVPPSYLVEIGLSREAVYYVFSELELKMPEGVDLSIPAMKPSLANRLSNSQTDAEITSPKQSPAESSKQAQSLLEMEQMKRRELLARKAVMASRKDKKPTKNESRTAGESRINKPTVTGSQVESFLQSIAPMVGKSTSSAQSDSKESTPPNDISNPSNPTTELSQGSFVRRSVKRPVAADFVDGFDNEQLSESKSTGFALPSDFLGEGGGSGKSVQTTRTTRTLEPTFNKVSVIRKCVIDFSDEEEDENDDPSSERIMSDLALVKAKEEEIRRLRERIERYRKGKQNATTVLAAKDEGNGGHEGDSKDKETTLKGGTGSGCKST